MLPAARPIDRANAGGKTPNGFSLSVKPSLLKSTVEKYRMNRTSHLDYNTISMSHF